MIQISVTDMRDYLADLRDQSGEMDEPVRVQRLDSSNSNGAVAVVSSFITVAEVLYNLVWVCGGKPGCTGGEYADAVRMADEAVKLIRSTCDDLKLTHRGGRIHGY